MCVLGNQILVVWLLFFYCFPRFYGVIKRGGGKGDIVHIPRLMKIISQKIEKRGDFFVVSEKGVTFANGNIN
jgi:F420-0:gamma-glutamyl ligase-like protein